MTYSSVLNARRLSLRAVLNFYRTLIKQPNAPSLQVLTSTKLSRLVPLRSAAIGFSKQVMRKEAGNWLNKPNTMSDRAPLRFMLFVRRCVGGLVHRQRRMQRPDEL